MTEDPAEYLRVGEVVKPHGIDGELVVDSTTEFPEERFAAGQVLVVFDSGQQDPHEESRELTVVERRWHQGRILLRTEEVTDRNDAEEYRGTWLGVRPDEEVGDEEVYVGHELMGLDVYTPDGTRRGTVVDVHPDEMNPLVKIDLGDDTMDFPLSPGLVLAIEPDENRLELRFPEGWKKLIDSSD